jgi:hypothetical protein
MPSDPKIKVNMFREERLTIEVAGQKPKTTCCTRCLFALPVVIIQHLHKLVNRCNIKNVNKYKRYEIEEGFY